MSIRRQIEMDRSGGYLIKERGDLRRTLFIRLGAAGKQSHGGGEGNDDQKGKIFPEHGASPLRGSQLESASGMPIRSRKQAPTIILEF
jgi:hypothetical protein